MTEMVERVARALCAYPFDLYDKIKDDPNEAKDQLLLQEQMERWRAMARAAIQKARWSSGSQGQSVPTNPA